MIVRERHGRREVSIGRTAGLAWTIASAMGAINNCCSKVAQWHGFWRHAFMR